MLNIQTLGPSGAVRASDHAARGAAALCAGLLALNVVLFALQQHLNDAAVLSQHGAAYALALGGGLVGPADMLRLPYPAIFHEIEPAEKYHVALVALAFAQAATLYGLWISLEKVLERPLVRMVLLLSGLLMIWQAIAAASLSSLDMYAYVGYAKLGFAHAYAPSDDAFPKDFAVINSLWGRPMVPCYYGPLWLALERLFAGSTATLAGAIFATRLLGLCALAFLAAALHRCQVAPRTLVLVVLNPAVLGLYVANGHNDLLGVAFTLSALAVVATAPLLASLLIAFAGLVKLPFLALSVVIFTGSRAFERRLLYVGLAVIVVVAASLLGGGTMYLKNLAFHAGNAGSHEWRGVLLGRIIAALAVVVLGVAFVRGKVFRAGSWTLFMMTGVVYQWYLTWGLPYAVRATAIMGEFLIGLPVAAALLDYAYPSLHYRQYAMVAIIAYVLYDLIRYRTRGISVSPQSAI